MRCFASLYLEGDTLLSACRVGCRPSMWSAQIAPFDRCGGSPIEGRLAARSGGYERHAGGLGTAARSRK